MIPAAHTARTHPANRLGGPRSGSAPLFEQVPQSFQHRPDWDLPVPVSPNSTAGGGPRDNALLLADDAGDGDQR